MRAIAIIPARGGSKSIPRKNLAMVAGKTLLAHAVDAARASRHVTSVVVTSDDREILDAASRLGAEIVVRPAELATDLAPTEPAITHALEVLEARGIELPEALVLLQTTSPLRTSADVDAALTLLATEGTEAVVSVFEPPHSPFKAFFERADGCLAGVVNDEAPFRPRQSLPRAWMPNGAIYAVRSAFFRAEGRLFAPRTKPYPMPHERSVDVDTLDDLARAESWLASHPREAA